MREQEKITFVYWFILHFLSPIEGDELILLLSHPTTFFILLSPYYTLLSLSITLILPDYFYFSGTEVLTKKFKQQPFNLLEMTSFSLSSSWILFFYGNNNLIFFSDDNLLFFFVLLSINPEVGDSLLLVGEGGLWDLFCE